MFSIVGKTSLPLKENVAVALRALSRRRPHPGRRDEWRCGMHLSTFNSTLYKLFSHRCKVPREYFMQLNTMFTCSCCASRPNNVVARNTITPIAFGGFLSVRSGEARTVHAGRGRGRDAKLNEYTVKHKQLI